MNDDENQHESWWGNLETIQTVDKQPEYDYMDNDDVKRKKFILIAVVIGTVLMLLLGGMTAFTVLSGNKSAEPQEKAQTQVPAKKKTEKKKSSDAKSPVFVMITADGAEGGNEASVSIAESGKKGKTIVSEVAVTVNETVKICKLPKGKYILTVDSAPDGYDKPAKSTSFTVSGDGKKVSAFAFLAKHVDKTSESNESDDETSGQAENTDEQEDSSISQDQSTQQDSSPANPSNDNQDVATNEAQSSSASASTTTKTIHHPAETQRIAICDTCGADITNDIEGHKKSTGHPWYHYEAKVIKEAWDETVTVN